MRLSPLFQYRRVLTVLQTVKNASSLFGRRKRPVLSRNNSVYSVRQLLGHAPFLMPIANCVSLDFLFTCQGVLLPLFFAMPSELGGVGFDPVHIGFILSSYRASMAFFMVTGGPWIIRYYGEKFAFVLAISSCMSIWIILPIINLYARRFGISTHVWAGVVALTIPLSVMELGIGRFRFVWDARSTQVMIVLFQPVISFSSRRRRRLDGLLVR